MLSSHFYSQASEDEVLLLTPASAPGHPYARRPGAGPPEPSLGPCREHLDICVMEPVGTLHCLPYLIYHT